MLASWRQVHEAIQASVASEHLWCEWDFIIWTTATRSAARQITTATRAISLGRLCYTTARDHAATRKQFGRSLSEFQGVQWKFAEMAVQLECSIPPPAEPGSLPM